MTIAVSNVRKLVAELTLEEKVRLVHGAADPNGSATGYLPGVERLGIPEFRLADGPLGVRVRGEPATLFPASIALAATFDPDLAREQGAAMGREAKARNQDALLGPGLNLIRVPHCGRNFEYYSEDPVVTAAFAGASVEGIQSANIVATPKHYVANNQETDRISVDVDVSERALRENYLPGFKAAVDAGAGSVMTAYNSVNGSAMSEHRQLVTEVLKDEWGFEGYVVSDWFGTASTVGSATGGLDLEMPGITRDELREAFGLEHDREDDGGVFGETEDLSGGMPDMTDTQWFAEPLLNAVQAGEVPEERVDDMVTRILRQMNRIGCFDEDRDDGHPDKAGHRTLAESIATRGMVLLQNDGVLPLADDVDIAVLGPGVQEITTGGGSSEMDALHEVPPAKGIRSRGEGDVVVARGVPKIERVSFFGGDEDDEETPMPRFEDAVDAAADADVAVVVVQDAATEAMDRESLRLPGRQDELVKEVAAVNDDTVVVVQSSGPVELPWRSDVSAVVESWYPGQSDGDALASVLFGDVDAGGRLPVTFANETDYPTASEETFPGTDGEVRYSEGLFVGYRYFDVADVEPIYPFGHGLSYAEFTYHSAEVVNDRRVRVTVENTADRDGREVVQAYVRSAEAAGDDRPIRELGGFTSVSIPAGETVTVDVDLDDLAFTRYDETKQWTPLDGPFTVDIGRSAGDTRLEVEL